MVIKYPDVSKDFPRLVRTLGTLHYAFDYWELVEKIYQNHHKKNLKSYFHSLRWFHSDKPYPISEDLEADWEFLKDGVVQHVRDTIYRVDHEYLKDSALSEYAYDGRIKTLFDYT
jgi:hypothetical protein